MMGTLARFLAEKQIGTPEENFWADVAGDIEDVGGVLKITRINVTYHLKVPSGKEDDSRQALAVYLKGCPAAQSVIGCIEILDSAVIEQIA
ncbi:MAG: OsmC family protein [Desulfomonile tiedjei]|nr:OsmC family protein [Desulfomonile tiedjei]